MMSPKTTANPVSRGRSDESTPALSARSAQSDRDPSQEREPKRLGQRAGRSAVAWEASSSSRGAISRDCGSVEPTTLEFPTVA